MLEQSETLDEYDLRILKVLEENAELPLTEIGRRVGILSASSVSKRISKLKERGFIGKINAKVNYERLGYRFSALSTLKVKYRKNFTDQVGKKLASMPNVVAVYNTLGDTDFVILTVSRNKDELANTLEEIMAISDVERVETQTILKTFKDMNFSGLFSNL